MASRNEKVNVWMQVVVSLFVLLFLCLLLTAPNVLVTVEPDEATKRWASGCIGAVVGYWLS